MLISIFFSVFTLVNSFAQCTGIAGFSINQVACDITCTPTNLKGGVGSWTSSPSGCISLVNNNVNYVATFIANPLKFPCSTTIVFTAAPSTTQFQNSVTCVQNITIDAQQVVTIIPSYIPDYDKNTVELRYVVCLTKGKTNSNPINLTIVPPKGLTLTGGSFNPKNSFTIQPNTLNQGNSCTQVIATFSSDPAILACGEWEVELKANAFCTQIDGNYQKTTIENQNKLTGTVLTSNLPKLPNHTVIDGELIIDAPSTTLPISSSTFTLNKTNLWMKADSKITVSSGNALEVLASNIKGCEMWQGINMEDNTAMRLSDGTAPARIEDAYVAISMDDAMLTTSKFAEFNHNEVSIKAERYAGLFIESTKFNGGLLKNGGNAAIGIQLNNTNVTKEVRRSEFSNIDIGIYGFDFGVLALESNRFIEDICGVWAETKTPIAGFGDLLVKGLGYDKMSPITFQNCNTGILANGTTKNNISNNRMENIENGCNIFNSLSSQVFHNLIASNILGIAIRDFQSNKSSSVYTTSNNNLSVNDGDGIILSSVYPIYKRKYYAEQNMITVNSPTLGMGIDGINVNALLCKDTIKLNGNNNVGINLDATTGFADINRVIGHSTDNNIGIQLTMCGAKHRVASNTKLDNTFYGVRYNGSVITELHTNSFYNHTFGLYLDKYGNIGLQPDLTINAIIQNNNQWLGTSKKLGAFHEDTTKNSPYKKSLFRVDPTTAKNVIPSLAPSQIDWFFKPLNKLFPIVPFGSCELTKNIPVNTLDNQVIESIIQKSIFQSTPRGLTQQWIAERQLYQILTLSEYQKGQNNLIDQFLEDNREASSRRFWDMESEIANLSEIPIVIQKQIEEADNALTIQYQKLNVLDSIFHSNVIRKIPNKPDFWKKRKSINDAILIQRKLLTGLYEHLTVDKIGKAAILKDKNKQIETEKIYETNEREINNIYLEMLINAQEDLNPEQEDIATHIALQCPEDGGFAVFRARVILSKKHNYHYNWDELCAKEPLNRVQKSTNFS